MKFLHISLPSSIRNKISCQGSLLVDRLQSRIVSPKFNRISENSIRFSSYSDLVQRNCTWSQRFSGAKLWLQRSLNCCCAMGVRQESGFAKRLWNKYEKEASLALYNPFIVALGAGSLPQQSFRHYVAQDAYFLKSYIQAYTMAEDCADDDEDKDAITALRNATQEELSMHNALSEEWSTAFETEYPPNSATLKYTEFLLLTAAGKVEGGRSASISVTPFEKTKIASYTVGAMTPCMRLYAFLGQEIAKVLKEDLDNHPYKQWIETYSSAQFEESALQIEELVDRLTISLTGEELEVLERLYSHALKLELEFFSAQPLPEKMIVPVLKQSCSDNHHYTIVSDFDLSCTVVDSSAVLAEIAIMASLKAELTPGLKSSTELRNAWDALSSQYCEEYEECLKKVLPSEEGNKFDYEGLYKCLQQISEFETEANSKVAESGVLQGININDIKKAGERLALQDGCANVFKQINLNSDNMNLDMHIISVCWSGDIIRATFSANSLEGLDIRSNELVFEDSVSTGSINRHVETPIDKLKVFESLIDSAKENGTDHTSIYIGDSLGDILCLLRADVGIVIGSSSSNIRRVGTQFGVSFVPLFSGIIKQERGFGEGSGRWKRESGILYTVSGWNEIHAFLLGSTNQ